MFSLYLIAWTLFFTPLLFLPFFEDPFRFSKIIFFYFCAALLITANSIRIFQKKQIILPNKKIFTVYCLLFTVYLSSTLTSIHPLTSFFGLHHAYIGSFLHLLALLIFSFSVLQINWQKKFYQVSIYISAAAGIASVFALMQFSQYFFDFGQLYRVRSTIGEPNRLSFFLSAALPFCLFLFFKTKNAWLKLISFLNCLLISTTILLTLSRSSWIALFLTFISLVFLYLTRIAQPGSNSKRILSSPAFCGRLQNDSWKKFAQKNQSYLIITLLIIAFSLPFLGAKILERNLAVIKDLKTGGGSVNLRLQNWQVVWKTIKNREKWHQHLLGTGLSTISYTFLKNRPPSLNQNPIEKNWNTSTVRNQFLDILTNVGILGLISFIAILISIFFHILKNLKTLAKNPIFWPIFSCFLVILFTSFLYYQTITTSIYFWFSLGILIGFLNKQKIKINKKICSFILIFEASLSLVSLFFLTKVSLADLNFSTGNFEKAVKINPYHDFYKRQLAHLLLKQAEDNKDFGKAKLAIKTAQEARELNSLSEANQYVLQLANYRAAVVFNKKKFHQPALKAGEKRIALDPAHAGPYDTQGLVYLDMGKLEKALEYFIKATKIDPDYLQSYLHIGEALKQMGKTKQAITYYQLALQKNPNWPFAQSELKKAQSLLDKQ